jgi:DNA-directed RNA polymerase subunit RPC12/RpoP
MKKERVTCPLCKKRILDIRINGDASLETKCMHCGHIINVKCSNRPKKAVTPKLENPT